MSTTRLKTGQSSEARRQRELSQKRYSIHREQTKEKNSTFMVLVLLVEDDVEGGLLPRGALLPRFAVVRPPEHVLLREALLDLELRVGLPEDRERATLVAGVDPHKLAEHLEVEGTTS